MATSTATVTEHREKALELADYALRIAPSSPRAALTMAEAQLHATLALSAPTEAPKDEAPAAEATTDDTPPAEGKATKPAPKRKRRSKAAETSTDEEAAK